MLEKEQFDPDQFLVVEYPTIRVYCYNRTNDGKHFITQGYKGQSTPFHTTRKTNEEGIDNFPCEGTEDSISHIEC